MAVTLWTLRATIAEGAGSEFRRIENPNRSSGRVLAGWDVQPQVDVLREDYRLVSVCPASSQPDIH